jgi:hypothetical protein
VVDRLRRLSLINMRSSRQAIQIVVINIMPPIAVSRGYPVAREGIFQCRLKA